MTEASPAPAGTDVLVRTENTQVSFREMILTLEELRDKYAGCEETSMLAWAKMGRKWTPHALDLRRIEVLEASVRFVRAVMLDWPDFKAFRESRRGR